MLKCLIADCVFKSNLFPVKGGVSPHCSPHHILTQQPVDFEHHCRITAPQTVLAHDKPTLLKSLKGCAIKGVCLGPMNIVQGGHWIHNPETKAKITCCCVTEVPATAAMIHGVNAIAWSDGMEKIGTTSKTGEILCNSDLIAGVEDPQNFEDPDHETEDEEDDESDQSSQEENLQKEHNEVEPNKVCEDV